MLLDTSGLLCYHSDGETQHGAAVMLFEAGGAKLTHSYVLAEFVALAHVRKVRRTPALRFVNSLLEHPQVEMVWVEETLHRQGVALLQARRDKDYSLADAVSFVLMRQRGVQEALTTDHHFAQEGFTRFL